MTRDELRAFVRKLPPNQVVEVNGAVYRADEVLDALVAQSLNLISVDPKRMDLQAAFAPDIRWAVTEGAMTVLTREAAKHGG